jgi:DNA-binding transcriptional LysR family regulator
MDIRQMKYFKTIVEEGTISKAAQVLHMAQPPLSIQLKQLEEELGITLLKWIRNRSRQTHL